MNHSRLRRRHGFFLILVLVVVAVATMAVYSFTELMLAADETAYLQGDLVQARLNVDTGVEAMRLILASPPADRDAMGGVYNNAARFRGVAITNSVDGSVQRFTVIAPGIGDTGAYGGIRFGLQNESARINVNALLVLEENSEAIGMLTSLSGGDVDAGGILGDAIGVGSGAASGDDEMLDADNIAVQLLMTLPGMDESTADAILDWIDTDSDPRPLGCEDEYYSSLTTPYACPNEPLKSVEELLLVRGVTPQLLFGADTNRNGVLDLDEQQRTAASIDTAGVLGWASYLTVHGGENNKTAAGDERVNVNDEDLEVLYDELLTALGDETYASFIVAYRMAGKSSIEDSAALMAVAAVGGGDGGDEVTSPTGGGSEDDSEKELWTGEAIADLDLTAGAGVEINQILDLIDAEVTIGEGDNAVVYMSPFIGDPALMAEYLPLLVDQLTTQDVDVLPGRINLNEAPAEILAGISLVDVDTMAAILEARNAGGAGGGSLESGSSTDRTHETWPLTEGIITLDQMRALMPLVTAGGDVFRAQVVGFDETTGLAARGEAIIDATTVNPRVVAYRDLTHLGRGFELSVLGGY
ncbi:DNA uptake protein ComE-like DNA-binding protein [Rhodopirellula rubra]|uniref:DNA uptake protein ComE-like DNA-binding protein n=1 Tax=Aporhodopirellula rubra TaxID=980271 RepID=A0A7W5DU83_9BACT|nr:type II secretion system protein GspK [Aporhodopirellula rubra]MBB3204659.1 DNA uptake protein ComE-like DNA-binding protein [Aporhodopirellula rubra]